MGYLVKSCDSIDNLVVQLVT